MASNLAARRAAKAIRRKAVLAEKRKLERQPASLAERARRASQAPIQHCMIIDGLFESGIATLLLARGHTTATLTMAAFLLDAFCLGIKDVVFRPISGNEFSAYVDALSKQTPLVPIDPGDARKLLRDLAAWARSIGFVPHRDFAAVEQMFGDVDAAKSATEFHFGREGKPFYIPGPSESPSLVRQRVEHLSRHLGAEKFDFLVPV